MTYNTNGFNIRPSLFIVYLREGELYSVVSRFYANVTLTLTREHIECSPTKNNVIHP